MKTDAEAALADLLQQLVRADDRAGGLRRGRQSMPCRRSRTSARAAPGSSPSSGAAASSASTPARRAGVAAAGLVQVGGPLGRRRPSPGRRGRSTRSASGRAWPAPGGASTGQCDGRAGDPLSRIGRIVRPGRRRRARRSSQARAKAQWRSAVAREMPRAAAASRDGQAGEVAELDQLGRGRVARRPAGRGPRRGRAGRRPAAGGRRRRRRGRPAGGRRRA